MPEYLLSEDSIIKDEVVLASSNMVLMGLEIFN